MDLNEAMNERHSVRKYNATPIEEEKLAALRELIAEANEEEGVSLQLVTNEPKAFGGLMSKVCGFSGVDTYIAVVGKDDPATAKKLGYYGEKIVLQAQTMGLNTCWAAGAFKKVKNAFTVGEGEKAHSGIAIGYGAESGKPHKNKDVSEVSQADNPPEWFVNGVKAALLAPTGMNMQNFKFTLVGERGVKAETTGGMCGDLNTGIAMYHFEIGAGKENFDWVG